MATPTIDVGFLSYFSPIFIFVLVFVMGYGTFQFTKLFGENKILHALIALFIAVVFLFSTTATTVVMFIAPWFTVLFIFIVFILMAYKLFGATDSQIKKVISKESSIQYFIIAVGIIILILGLGMGFGQELLESAGGVMETRDALTEAGEGSTATASFQKNLVATLFNSKILGMVLIMIVAAFTIRAMTSPLRKDWHAEGNSDGSGEHH